MVADLLDRLKGGGAWWLIGIVFERQMMGYWHIGGRGGGKVADWHNGF